MSLSHVRAKQGKKVISTSKQSPPDEIEMLRNPDAIGAG
jgi:hypothetical protein